MRTAVLSRLSAAVKLSMMSAIIILRTMNVESVTYVTKKGMAADGLPQSPRASEHRPVSGDTMASCMMLFHPSPVAQRKRVSTADEKVQKLASAFR